MAKLITTDDQLRQYLPNVFATVKGETSLYDKISQYIEAAELWVKSTFTGEAPFNTISGYSDSNSVKPIAARIIAYEALRAAIPSLDLVLTPNGFGVVSSNNVAPASKQRVDRLIGQLTALRDSDIESFIPLLPNVSKWKTMEQYKWFSATLFPNLDVVNAFGETSHRWDKYLELRSKIIDIETSLAEDFFSPELFTTLRQRVLSQDLQDADRTIVDCLRAQIIAVLKGENINMRKMIEIVNIIRNAPNDFPEWHNSDVAKLFSPPIFSNSKQSHGYFF